MSGVITQQQIETLPLATRQPVALALLMPGTSQDAVRPRKFNVTVGAGGFTHAAALLVDGMWNKEGNTGEPRMDLPQAAIREFKVYVSQAPAEYGWTAGGVVTFETKSGTNLWSGEVFEYFRDKSLNTMNRFEQERHDTSWARRSRTSAGTSSVRRSVARSCGIASTFSRRPNGPRPTCSPR